MRIRYSCVTWLLIACAATAAAQERIAGRAKITDGDSLQIGATHIRLFGVDAPEGRQDCRRDGRKWRCGDAAAAELRRLVDSRDIACVRKDTDDYGRVVAVCRRGNVDLGAAMVQAGMALAYRQFSSDYVDEETAARAARRGLWAGEFTPPWEWRRTQRATEARPASRDDGRATQPARTSNGCRIKGNINADGQRIYHVPGSASYDSTRIDESRGERWFCSEQEARRNGWRAPRA